MGERALPGIFQEVGKPSSVSGAVRAAMEDGVLVRDTSGDDTYTFLSSQGGGQGTLLPASEDAGRTKGSNLRGGVIVTGKIHRGRSVVGDTDHRGLLQESEGRVVLVQQKGQRFVVSDQMQEYQKHVAALSGGAREKAGTAPQEQPPAVQELEKIAEGQEERPATVQGVDVVITGEFGSFSLTYHWATSAPPCYIVLGFRKGTSMFTPAANKPVLMTVEGQSLRVVFTGIQFEVPQAGLILHIFQRVAEAGTGTEEGDQPIL